MEEISALAAPEALQVFGAFHPGADDDLPEGCGTVVLLSPREPGFWDHFTTQPEYRDGRADPLDRWSERAIRKMATDLNAKPFFPSAGPPYKPFFKWALRTGRAWPSPVTLMVHDTMGLWASIRGALALPQRIPLPITSASPCLTCDTTPCRGACPVGAFTDGGYDVDACHRHLSHPAGHACMTQGCRTRSVCPVSETYGRMAQQSAFHMAAFHS